MPKAAKLKKKITKLTYPKKLYKKGDPSSIADWLEEKVIIPLFSTPYGGAIDKYKSDGTTATRLSDDRQYHITVISEDGDHAGLLPIAYSFLEDYNLLQYILTDEELIFLENNLDWYTDSDPDIMAFFDDAGIDFPSADYFYKVINEIQKRLIYTLWSNSLLRTRDNEYTCNSILNGFRDYPTDFLLQYPYLKATKKTPKVKKAKALKAAVPHKALKEAAAKKKVKKTVEEKPVAKKRGRPAKAK
jgi:hypothetical protein